MPRVGSREWNRQENLRRQREAEQVVQATPVNPIINITNEFVVEAQPLECRRDIIELREQLQNKITQIEQLKTNMKEFKKQIKQSKKNDKIMEKKLFTMFNIIMNRDDDDDDLENAFERRAERGGECNIEILDRNIRMMYEKFMMMSNQNKKSKDLVEQLYRLKEQLDLDGYKVEGKDTLCDFNYDLTLTECEVKEGGENPTFVFSDKYTTHKGYIQNYIKYLETFITANPKLLIKITKGANFKTFCKEYKTTDKFRTDLMEGKWNSEDDKEPYVSWNFEGKTKEKEAKEEEAKEEEEKEEIFKDKMTEVRETMRGLGLPSDISVDDIIKVAKDLDPDIIETIVKKL